MNNQEKNIDRDHIKGLLADNGAQPDDLDRYDEYMSRRGFFGRMGAVAALAGLGVGSEVALQGLFGRGLMPVAWAEEAEQQVIPGKEEMTLHNARPVNGEFAPEWLDDDVTPTKRHFVRNNGLVPERAKQTDAQNWALSIDGEVHQTLKLSLDDLRAMPSLTMPLLIECGGNGRANFTPKVRGNPWGRGAIACSSWTGVPLREILTRAGLKTSAIYTGHFGEDPPLGKAPPFSRGIPIDKAMDLHTLVAYKMNGQDLNPLNGYPVRLVVPGWVGSCSQKWLNRIWVRDQVHDSKKMTGYSYRVPAYPVVPGVKPPKEDMVIATSWVVKSMITRPKASSTFKIGERIYIRGHAWAGEQRVRKVLLSSDYGRSWTMTRLRAQRSKYAWATFEGSVSFRGKGYYEVWARAVDSQGNTQPVRQPWNPKGYLGNVIHRVPLSVEA